MKLWLVPAVALGMMTGSAMASAADTTTGVVRFFDQDAMIMTLESGQAFDMSKRTVATNVRGFRPGATVTVVYVADGDRNVASDLVVYRTLRHN